MVHGNDNGRVAVVAIEDQVRVVLQRIEAMHSIERRAALGFRSNPLDRGPDLIVESLG
jgi:hypothetical protein